MSPQPSTRQLWGHTHETTAGFYSTMGLHSTAPECKKAVAGYTAAAAVAAGKPVHASKGLPDHRSPQQYVPDSRYTGRTHAALASHGADETRLEHRLIMCFFACLLGNLDPVLRRRGEDAVHLKPRPRAIMSYHVVSCRGSLRKLDAVDRCIPQAIGHELPEQTTI